MSILHLQADDPSNTLKNIVYIILCPSNGKRQNISKTVFLIKINC